MCTSPLGHLQIAAKERCVHDAQDIFPGRRSDLLAYRTRPFVPACFQVVGVARRVGRSLLDKLGSSARLRVPSVRGISTREKALVKLPSAWRRSGRGVSARETYHAKEPPFCQLWLGKNFLRGETSRAGWLSPPFQSLFTIL